MNQLVFEAVLAQLQSFIEEKEFKQVGDYTYQNQKLQFTVGHNQQKQMLELTLAEVAEDGTVGEGELASAFLFDHEEDLRDAASAGMDFLDTLKGKLGMRGVRSSKSGEVAMPSKTAGDSKNIEALCAKLLAVFPQYKDAYKDHVTLHGKLLYITFFKHTFAKGVGEQLDKNNKKQLKKTMDLLDDMYCNGDRSVQNAIVGIVLGGAVYQNTSRYETAIQALADHTYLKNALVGLHPNLCKDKRFAEMLAE